SQGEQKGGKSDRGYQRQRAIAQHISQVGVHRLGSKNDRASGEDAVIRHYEESGSELWNQHDNQQDEHRDNRQQMVVEHKSAVWTTDDKRPEPSQGDRQPCENFQLNKKLQFPPRQLPPCEQ